MGDRRRPKLFVVPIGSTWTRRSLSDRSRARLPTPAEPERVAPASASRSGPVPRVGAPERRWPAFIWNHPGPSSRPHVVISARAAEIDQRRRSIERRLIWKRGLRARPVQERRGRPGERQLERQGTGRRHGVSVGSWSRQFVLLPEQTVSEFKFQFPNLNFHLNFRGIRTRKKPGRWSGR
jgi:hypothetical protein